MEPQSTTELSLNDAKKIMRTFVDYRDWHQYHTPRNLLLALVGEVGYLSEIFQWKGEVKPGLEGLTNEEKEHTKQEVADVFAYLIRFCDVANIDLGYAFLAKMEQNRKKYPKDKAMGSSAKYTAYQN